MQKKEKESFRNDWFFAKSGSFIELSVIRSDGPHGTAPSDRPILEYIDRGVVVTNKPSGPTSHEIAAYVRDILGVSAAGHSGSLDPAVTGVQPVMIGKATRAVAALRLSGKEYICLMKLHRPVSDKLIRSAVSQFSGNVYQMPPVRSAVKRALRLRRIYYIDILEIQEKYVLMRVGCEAGTYIRKLCHDIGLSLGVGAQMQELVRSKAGPFDDSRLVSLQELKDAYVLWRETGDESELRHLILPMESAFSQLPSLVVRDTAVDALCSGAFLAKSGVLGYSTNIQKGDLVAVFTQKGEVVSLSTAMMTPDEIQGAPNGFVAKPKAVLMDKGIYPKVWKNRQIREECSSPSPSESPSEE